MPTPANNPAALYGAALVLRAAAERITRERKKAAGRPDHTASGRKISRNIGIVKGELANASVIDSPEIV